MVSIKNNTMNILITGVGGPTPRSFAIALKKYATFTNLRLIATDINPLSIGLYQKDLFDVSYVVPRATDANYWEVIEKIIAEEQIVAAVILPELEVMEWALRNEKHALPCKVLLPTSAMASLLVDKSKMTELLSSLDLVPPSVSFSSDIEDVSFVFDALGDNFWVRSSSGTSGLGSLHIDSKEALKNWIQINPGVSHFLASKFLTGRNLACKLLYWKGNLVRAACAERVNYIMSKVAPSGITGNTSFGRLLNETALVEIASEAMDQMFAYTNSTKHGFYTVDFKEDATGKPYITEVNVRHVAFTQCFAAGGANFAADTIKLLTDPTDFDGKYRMYEFEKDLIFLRDVDALPIIMKESDLLKPLF
jgi:carbamoyl-phosphate synthase large subunit